VRGALHRSGRVFLALVSGVHSARAKRLLITRMAEQRGVTTFAPLVQVALPGFRDVAVRIAMRESNAHAWLEHDDARIAADARGAMLALATGPTTLAQTEIRVNRYRPGATNNSM
jgi:hypothetical protein